MELTLLPVRNPLWNFSLHHAKFDVELLTLGVEVHVGVRTLYRESPRGVFVDSTWSPRCFSGFRCELGAESTHGNMEKWNSSWIPH